MKRGTINALIDLGCLVTFLLSLLTGLVLYFFLPSGGGRGGSWVTWMDITRHDWVLYHNISSFVFAALLIIHLILHLAFFTNIRKHLAAQESDECPPRH